MSVSIGDQKSTKPAFLMLKAPSSENESSRTAPRVRIAIAPHHLPPGPDRVDREAGRVMVDADPHPADVASDVVDPVRDRSAQFRDPRVVHTDRLGLPLWPRFPASVLEVANRTPRQARNPGQGPTHQHTNTPPRSIAVYGNWPAPLWRRSRPAARAGRAVVARS